MTQQEFTERTGYVPNSQIEFWLIHEDYMRSDYDKDEFCKRWKLTNKFLRRVAIAEMDCVIKEAEKWTGTPKFAEFKEILEHLVDQIEFLTDQIINGNK